MKRAERKSKIRKIIIALILVHFFLFVLKWVPSQLFGSVSLEADAFHSISDIGYTIVLLVGLEWALKSKDGCHPHGHERIEPFVSLFIAVTIGLTGVFVVRNAVLSIADPVFEFSPYLLIVLIISMAVKFYLSKKLAGIGKKFESTALVSTSEDAKTDVLVSLTAFVGILGARFGTVWLDSVFGLMVSVWIFKTAYEIGKKSFDFLTGASAPEELISEIDSILDGNDKVLSFHDLEAHYVGPKVHVSVSVHLPEDLGFEEVHEVEENLKDEIKSMKKVDSAYLHVEPDSE